MPLASIAVSLVGHKDTNYLTGKYYFETAAQVVLALLPKIREDNIPANQVLNVNVPNVPYKELKGMLATHLGDRSPAAEIIKQQDPRGAHIYWIGASGKPIDESEGTDFYAIKNGYVSITPIQADMTAHQSIQTLKGLL